VNWVVIAVFIGERQRRAPERLQARVGISGRMLMTGSNAIGAAIASGASELLSLRPLFLAMAGGTVLVAAAAAAVVPRATPAIARR
jgi:hypothetical protein